MSESFPQETSYIERVHDQFPMPEDWEALQGGKPRVFYKPGSAAAWLVVHVYEQHDDPDKRFFSGAVVGTIPPETPQLLDKYILRTDFEGNQVKREVKIPSFMDRTVHGDVCEARSGTKRASAGYEKIKSQPEYEQFIQRLITDRYMELRFSVTKDGEYKLQPQEIIPSRSLKGPSQG